MGLSTIHISLTSESWTLLKENISVTEKYLKSWCLKLPQHGHTQEPQLTVDYTLSTMTVNNDADISIEDDGSKGS